MSEELLELAAQALGPLCNEVVFLGGATVHLWITDPVAPSTRATDDVDVISAISTRVGYYALAERLRARGFREASDANVICRWYHVDSGLVLDVMPQAEEVLGFTNRWYPFAVETAVDRRLPSGVTIHAATPVAIVLTKLAAWKSRGNDDPLRSLDLHDIIVLLDGRASLTGELLAAPPEARSYIVEELQMVADHHYFDYLVEGVLHGYGVLAAERSHLVRTRIRELLDHLRQDPRST